MDESGFFTRTAARARAKVLMSLKGRSNAIELSWAKNAKHVTILPVTSACDKVCNPVVMFPGKHIKYRERPGPVPVGQQVHKKPACYLSPQFYTMYRDFAGMNTLTFNTWAALFVKKTASLRTQFKNIVITLDGFGAHV